MQEVVIHELPQSADGLSLLALLHKQGLSDTITSNRGVGTIEKIYSRLALSGHTIYRATADTKTLGGLVVFKNGLNRQSIFIVFTNPLSWFCAIRALGLKDFLRQLVDLVAVKRIAQSLPPTDYGVALYVDEAARRMGVARSLLTRALADAELRGVSYSADVLLENTAIRNLYSALGLREAGRTRFSVILTTSLA
jgi:GNAT superfamily N-acetyltransferase